MTTSTTHRPEAARNTPTWLNAVIVLLMLIVGCWAVWYFAIRHPKGYDLGGQEEVIDNGNGRRGWAPPTSQAFAGVIGGGGRGQGGGGRMQGGGGRGNMGNVAAPVRDEAIRRTGSGGIRARHNDVLLTASYSPTKGVADVDLNYSFDLMEKWVTPQEIQLHMLAWRASNISSTGLAIGLTAEQKQKLLALSYHMPVTPDELAKVRILLTSWVAAENNAPAREKASAAILASMAQFGKLYAPQTKALFQARLAAIPTILKPEQIEKLQELLRGGNAPATPTPVPAPRPAAVPAPAAVPVPTAAPAAIPTGQGQTGATAGPAITLVPGTVPTPKPTTKPAP